MRLLEWLITILILVCACGIFYTAFADTETTALPSWVHGEGYSECDEDVRVVVSLTPLKASDIKMLLTDDYEFVTVILYNGKFHWYFVRYESYLVDGDLMRYFIIDELLEGDYK